MALQKVTGRLAAAWPRKSPRPRGTGAEDTPRHAEEPRGWPPVGQALPDVDFVVLGFANEDHADHEGDGRDHDRVPEAVVDISLGRHHGEGDCRQEAAEP